jgi:hypothetical protein
MNSKSIFVVCLLIGFAAGSACAQQKTSADPISGTWTGDWGPSARQRTQVTLELHFDGKTLTGTVNPGPEAIPLKKASFDPKTSAVHIEVDAPSPDGSTVHYVVDGKLDKNMITGSWVRDNGKGDFKIKKS